MPVGKSDNSENAPAGDWSWGFNIAKGSRMGHPPSKEYLAKGQGSRVNVKTLGQRHAFTQTVFLARKVWPRSVIAKPALESLDPSDGWDVKFSAALTLAKALKLWVVPY